MREAYLFRPLPGEGAFFYIRSCYTPHPALPDAKARLMQIREKIRGIFGDKGRVAVLLSCHAGLPPDTAILTLLPSLSVIPRLRSNRPGIYELILSCHGTAFFLSSVIPQHFLSSCHTGLRAGIQVNIDSLAAWIPGQARNDSKKTRPE